MLSSTPPCSTFLPPTHHPQSTLYFLRVLFVFLLYLETFLCRHNTKKWQEENFIFSSSAKLRGKSFFSCAKFSTAKTLNGVTFSSYYFFLIFFWCCCLLISVKINNKIYETVFVIVCQRHV